MANGETGGPPDVPGGVRSLTHTGSIKRMMRGIITRAVSAGEHTGECAEEECVRFVAGDCMDWARTASFTDRLLLDGVLLAHLHPNVHLRSSSKLLRPSQGSTNTPRQSSKPRPRTCTPSLPRSGARLWTPPLTQSKASGPQTLSGGARG